VTVHDAFDTFPNVVPGAFVESAIVGNLNHECETIIGDRMIEIDTGDVVLISVCMFQEIFHMFNALVDQLLVCFLSKICDQNVKLFCLIRLPILILQSLFLLSMYR